MEGRPLTGMFRAALLRSRLPPRALPRFAPPRSAATRLAPPVRCPVFGFDKLPHQQQRKLPLAILQVPVYMYIYIYIYVCVCVHIYIYIYIYMHEKGLQRHLSNPKPGHTTGGSGRGARRSGRAGSGKIGCRQNYSPRIQRSPVLSKASKKRRFNVSPKARTSEILCKPTEEQNQRLTTGLSAVYYRDEKRSLFLAADQWNDSFLFL